MWLPITITRDIDCDCSSVCVQSVAHNEEITCSQIKRQYSACQLKVNDLRRMPPDSAIEIGWEWFHLCNLRPGASQALTSRTDFTEVHWLVNQARQAWEACTSQRITKDRNVLGELQMTSGCSSEVNFLRLRWTVISSNGKWQVVLASGELYVSFGMFESYDLWLLIVSDARWLQDEAW